MVEDGNDLTGLTDEELENRLNRILRELHKREMSTSRERDLEHRKDQMRFRYVYLVGEWAGARRAKETATGVIVSTETVVNYIKGAI